MTNSFSLSKSLRRINHGPVLIKLPLIWKCLKITFWFHEVWVSQGWLCLTHQLLNISQGEEVCPLNESTTLLRQFLPFSISGLILDSWMSNLGETVHVRFSLQNICGSLFFEWGNGMAECEKSFKIISVEIYFHFSLIPFGVTGKVL